MTLCTLHTASTKPARRPGRPPSGKSCSSSGGSNRSREPLSAKVRSAYRRSLDPCDNSNDSGIGFDHHVDPHHHTLGMAERLAWTGNHGAGGGGGERSEAKRQKLDIKLENEEVNDSYSFPETSRTTKDNISLIRTAPVSTVPPLSMSTSSTSTTCLTVPRCIPLTTRPASSSSVTLTAQLLANSRFTDVTLTIVKQPEQQHRARYQTEGSRGAVKDREGNGFPVVQLTGYYKPATLQVFIGTDIGKVSPHMFYQACKVSGKNSTPCMEKKLEGTCVIELQLDPSRDMSATCDCVGILKERNVDVEHRFPNQLGNRSKKKSTRCRMIFRTTIVLDDGTQETLQVCSQPIVCTQPPGIPEICKKSLTSCPASGGLELFVLGKNFLKDTKVFFQQYEDMHVCWEQGVVPDKEYLQQTHFVCVIPPYRRADITEPVTVRLCVVSSGKTSESHQFVYTPVNGAVPSVHHEPPNSSHSPTFFKGTFWQAPSSSVGKKEQDLDIMPPPESSLVPMASRRPSISLPSTSEVVVVHSPPLHTFKQEYMDENSQGSVVEHETFRHLSESSMDVHHGDSNTSMINENSMMSHLNENSNISVGNEESSMDAVVCRNSVSRNEENVEVMIRRNSMSRSLDCINDDSSCSAMMHPADRSMLPELLNPIPSAANIEKVIDLRMKMPMATVADLVNTTAPSMATLQRFGIVDNLPNQSAQSVENYLTKIEAKPSMIPMTNPTGLLMKNDLSEKLTQIMSAQQNLFLTTPAQNLTNFSVVNREPVYLSSSRPLMSGTTQNDVANIVAKSESADVPEQSIPEQTNTMASSNITTIATSLERSVPTPINTDKLDALVNSTVESHLSPTRSASSPKNSLTRPDIVISSDVMLNSQSSLMVPPLVNTRLNSPVLGAQDMTNSSNLTPDVILNSQISPSLMCRNADTLMSNSALNICQTTTSVEPTLLSSTINAPPPSLVTQASISAALTSEPEKAVLLKAAVDLLETQKQISELGTLPSSENFVQSQFPSIGSSMAVKEQKPEFVLPIAAKEIVPSIQNDKKNEDGMIPNSFTALTENELINLINPSCFDQV